VIRTGLSYWVRGPQIEWDRQPLIIKGDDYLFEAAAQARNPTHREHRFEIERASEWLHQRLSEGPVLSQIVQEDAGMNFICYGTLRRAFKAIGAEAKRECGKGLKAKWVWRLKGEDAFFRADAPRIPVHAGTGLRVKSLMDIPERKT
jgi:hypothetical protein